MTQGHWEICAFVAAGSQAEYNGESKMAPGAYVWTSEPSPSAWNSIQVRDGQLSWQCFTQLPLRVWHRIWKRRPLCFAVDINQHRIIPSSCQQRNRVWILPSQSTLGSWGLYAIFSRQQEKALPSPTWISFCEGGLVPPMAEFSFSSAILLTPAWMTLEEGNSSRWSRFAQELNG